MKSIGLITLYKCGNIGDAVIFQSAINILDSKIKLKSVNLLSVSLKGLFSRKVPLTMDNGHLEKLTTEIFDPSHKNETNLIFRTADWLKLFFDSKIILFWGGHWLHDCTWYNLPLLSLFVVFSKTLGKKVVLFGIGAGPITKDWSKKLCQFFFSKVDYLSVRDEYSLETLQASGLKNIHLSADPTLAMLIKPNRRKNRNSPLIGLNIAAKFSFDGRWETSSSVIAEKIDRVVLLVKSILRNTKAKIIFLASMFPEDVEIFKRVYEKCGEKQRINFDIKKMPTIRHYFNAINKLNALVGMRLHPLIFAYLLKISPIALPYDQKVKTFVKMIGKTDDCFEFREKNIAKIVSQVNSLLKTKPGLPRDKSHFDRLISADILALTRITK